MESHGQRNFPSDGGKIGALKIECVGCRLDNHSVATSVNRLLW